MKNNLKHPFNVMRYSDWDAAPRMPGVFAAAFAKMGVTGGITLFGTTIAYSTILGYAAYTAVSMIALRALAPDLGAMNKGTQVNTRSSIANQEYVYGQVRKGGIMAHMEATGNDNKYLHVFVALAGHEVEEIGDIYLNDQVVTLDGDGFVTSQNWNSKVFIKKFTGASSQTVFDDINALSGTLGADGIPASIDTNFKGKNIACVYMRLEYNQSTFTNGVPVVTAVVKGRKVFDPRTSTTAWSDNAALCIRDYITQSFGLNDSSVNNTYFSAAANDCDDSIPLAAGGGQARYTINGVVNAGSTTGQTLNDMISACNGSLFYSGGEWRLKVGVYTSPVKTLTLDDLRSEIDIPTRISRRDNFNRVVGKFIKGGVFDADTNPDGGDWIETEYPALESTAFTNEDNGIENTLDLPLYFITDASRAQRVAKQTLFRSREQISFSAEFGMNAMGLEVGDIVSLDIDEYGWSGKTFEVSSWKLLISQEGGVRVAMTLRETSSAAFAWDAEETDLVDNDTDLPNPSAGLTVSGLTVTGGGRTQGDGTFINSALVNWNDVTNAFLDYYDVEWKAVADSTYSATTASSSDIELSPLVDGVEYIIRVRAVTNGGVRGDWATTTFTGGGDETGPSLPTGVTAEGGFEYIKLTWVNPADDDFNYVEVWESEDTSFSNASQIAIATGNTFVRTNLGVNVTRHYWLRAFDYTGNGSKDEFGQPAYTAREQATTTFVDDGDFSGGVYSLFQDQGLYAIEDVDTLPTSGMFEGQKVYNRKDGKLYRYSDEPFWEEISVEAYLSDSQVRSPYLGQIIRKLSESVSSSGISFSGFERYENGRQWAGRSVFVYSSLPPNPANDQYVAIVQPDEYIFVKQTDQVDIDGTAVYDRLSVSYGSISTSFVDTFVGKYYYNTSLNVLYEYTGSSWTSRTYSIATFLPDSTGSTIYRLPLHKIYRGRGEGEWTPVIAETGKISADKIEANTITAGLLAASGVITNSAQINDAIISNAKIQNLAVDTIKVANDAITRHNFSDFSNQTGAGTHTFNFNTTMDFPGSIVAQAFVNSLGSASSGDTLTMGVSIFRGTSSSPGSLLAQKTYVITGGGAVGLYPVTVFTDISQADIDAESGNFYARVQTLTSGVVSPEVNVSVLLLRRFK